MQSNAGERTRLLLQVRGLLYSHNSCSLGGRSPVLGRDEDEHEPLSHCFGPGYKACMLTQIPCAVTLQAGKLLFC